MRWCPGQDIGGGQGNMDIVPSKITWELWKMVRSSWRPSKQYTLLTGQLPSKEMSSINNIAKGYSDLEIEAGIVVQVVWCWTKQVTFLSVSFLYIKRQSVSSVQSLSHVWLFVTPWTAAHQASLSNTNSKSLLKLVSIESVMPSNHLILCHPLLLPPSIFPSIRSFSMSRFFASGCQSAGISASASVLPMNIQDWFPLGWTGWISLQSKGLSVEEEKKNFPALGKGKSIETK